MPRSRDDSPRLDASQLSRVDPEKMTWNTCAPVSSSTVPVSAAPGETTAKLVEFSTTSGDSGSGSDGSGGSKQPAAATSSD